MAIRTLLSNMKIKIYNIDATRVGTWWRLKKLNSPFSRLFLITGGEAYVQQGGREYHLKPGVLHLIPRFTDHNIYCPSYLDLFFLHFTCELSNGTDLLTIQEYDYNVKTSEKEVALFRRLLEINPDKMLEDFKVKYKHLYKPIYRSNYKVKAEESLANTVESEGLIRLLLTPILRSSHKYSDSENYKPTRFTDVLEYINVNLNDKITLSDLAKVVHLNPTYFSNLFNKTMGIRPMRFLNKRRIEEAQLLMVDISKTLTEIAFDVGFNDLAHFSKTFKQHVGVGPGHYRLHHILF